MLRHAFIGLGGIGGLLAAALARAGASTTALVRPGSDYRGRLVVESTILGDFEADVPAASVLDGEVDVVWVAVKAPQLESALGLAPPDIVGEATVIPLMNGIDHMAVLRSRYPSVVAGAIRVESERVAPGRIRQPTPFVRVELAGMAAAAADLRDAGIECTVRPGELSLLWDKLAFLGPVALATTALDASLGGVRDDDRFIGCREETLAVAGAEGARVDGAAVAALARSAPPATRSSMQKDVDAGREPELDAIAGPILRGGRGHGIAVPQTEELVRLVKRRLAQ